MRMKKGGDWRAKEGGTYLQLPENARTKIVEERDLEECYGGPREGEGGEKRDEGDGKERLRAVIYLI